MAEVFRWIAEQFSIDPTRPLYEQMVEQIRFGIARGTIEPGSRIPSVRDLAAALRVNPNTVMRTYQELERLNLIVTYRGQGTFVTKDLQEILNSKRVIAIEAVAKLHEIAKSLGISIDELLELAKEEE